MSVYVAHLYPAQDIGALARVGERLEFIGPMWERRGDAIAALVEELHDLQGLPLQPYLFTLDARGRVERIERVTSRRRANPGPDDECPPDLRDELLDMGVDEGDVDNVIALFDECGGPAPAPAPKRTRRKKVAELTEAELEEREEQKRTPQSKAALAIDLAWVQAHARQVFGDVFDGHDAHGQAAVTTVATERVRRPDDTLVVAVNGRGQWIYDHTTARTAEGLERVVADARAQRGFGNAYVFTFLPLADADERDAVRTAGAAELAEQCGDICDSGRPPVPASSATLDSGVRVLRGADTRVMYPTAQGVRALRAWYALVPREAVITSHDPLSFAEDARYPADFQERDYARDRGEQQKVVTAALPERFRLEFIANTNPDAINGPPVVDTHGRVLGGNSRAMIVKRVASTDPDRFERELAETIAAHCSALGLEGAPTEGAMLVRVLEDGQVDPREASTLLNRAFTREIGAEAGAVAIGGLIPVDVYVAIGAELVDLPLREAIRRQSTTVVRALQSANVITPSNETSWLRTQSAGRGERRTVAELSNAGVDRLVAAMVGALVADKGVLSRTSPRLQGLYERIAPICLALEASEAGEYDFVPALREAIAAAPSVPYDEVGFIEHFANERLFGGDDAGDVSSPLAAVLLRWLALDAQHKPAQAAKGVLAYWRGLPEEVRTPGASSLLGLMGAEPESPDALRVRTMGTASVADVEAAPSLRDWLAGITEPAVPSRSSSNVLAFPTSEPEPPAKPQPGRSDAELLAMWDRAMDELARTLEENR